MTVGSRSVGDGKTIVRCRNTYIHKSLLANTPMELFCQLAQFEISSASLLYPFGRCAKGDVRVPRPHDPRTLPTQATLGSINGDPTTTPIVQQRYAVVSRSNRVGSRTKSPAIGALRETAAQLEMCFENDVTFVRSHQRLSIHAVGHLLDLDSHPCRSLYPKNAPRIFSRLDRAKKTCMPSTCVFQLLRGFRLVRLVLIKPNS